MRHRTLFSLIALSDSTSTFAQAASLRVDAAHQQDRDDAEPAHTDVQPDPAAADS